MFFYLSVSPFSRFTFFFFNDTATTEIYTLSLHDALPISVAGGLVLAQAGAGDLGVADPGRGRAHHAGDRKSTRLNSSHTVTSYAVFCLKKKKKQKCTPLNTKKQQTDNHHNK